jgi:CopG family transcriptional regulator/antitoxin EndoAI
MKRVVVGFPEEILRDMDDLLCNNNQCRSDIIREACCFYLEEKRKAILRDQMKAGYQEMAEINRILAEEIASDLDTYETYDYIRFGWRKA